jgi:hypothetical protein
VEVAGRTLENILQPLPNLLEVFVWDGLDYLGRPVLGLTSARVSIGFVYDGVYNYAADSVQAFAQSSSAMSFIKARQEIISWKQKDIGLHVARKEQGILAQGWTLSIHHYLGSTDLHKGDGTISRSNSKIIDTIAGTGTAGYSGDGGLAIEAMLRFPSNIASDASGNLYIADSSNHRIRKVDQNGIITTVAGTGIAGYSGDGGPALSAQLNGPYHIQVDASGNLYIVDYGNKRIRKVDPNGIITTIAGTGTFGYSGDGGPAVEASFGLMDGIALDSSGNIYVSDSSNYRIRKIDTKAG